MRLRAEVLFSVLMALFASLRFCNHGSQAFFRSPLLELVDGQLCSSAQPTMLLN